MLFQLIGYALPGLGVGGGLFLLRDIGPDFRKIRVELQQVLQARFGVRLDRFDRTFRFAHSAIDAFVGMDDKHVLALVEAIHGAYLDAVHVFALDATFDNDIGHLQTLRRGD